MESKIKELANSQIELEIEISAREFDKYFERAVSKIGEDLEIEGFRKGRAPRKIIEQRVGREAVLAEAAELAVKESYVQTLLDKNLEVISQPEVNILKLAFGNPFIFRARTAVLPKIELPDYRKIAQGIKRKKVSVEDKEINDSLKWLQKSRAKLTLKNEAAREGDFVEIEYFSPQIKELSGNKQKDAFVLGEGGLIPNFEDNLKGMRAGEEKEFSLELSSKMFSSGEKKADFKVKMESVKNMELPEISDEFAQNLGNFKDLEGLKKNIKEGIAAEKKQAESQRAKKELLEKISGELECEIPEILIEREKKSMMENFKKEISEKVNVSFEDYLKKIGKTEEDLLNSVAEEAEKRVKIFFILREIGKKEKIEVSEKEIESETDKILQKSSAVDRKEELDIQRLKDYAKEVIRNKKIFAFLENLIPAAVKRE